MPERWAQSLISKAPGSSLDMMGSQNLAHLRLCVWRRVGRSLGIDMVDLSMGDGSVGKVFPKHARGPQSGSPGPI